MATFKYEALNAQGKKQTGTMEGDSARQIRQLLKERQLSPLKVQPVNEVAFASRVKLSGFKKKLSTAELSLMIRQLHTLISAGKPLADALQVLAQQAQGRTQQQFLTHLYDAVAEGHALAAALRQSPFKVPEEVIATIAAGEESGHMSAVLSRLAEAIERQEKLNKKMKAALIYPILMVVVAVTIVFFLVVYVVPKVVEVFANMHQTLPPLTQGLIHLSAFLQQHWLGLLLGLIGSVIGFKLLMRRPKWRFRFESLLLRLPGVRTFLIYAASARWARTLGVLLDSGVPTLQALHISAETMSLLPLKQKVVVMSETVRKGKSISFAMQEAGFFPLLLVNLAETGEGNGQLSQMLLKGAERYEEDVETAAQTLISILEPALIIVMGGVVLTIVLAIMLPIFSMNQMVGH